MSKQKKTNAMRLLDTKKISYTTKSYTYTEEDLSGIHAAEAVGLPVDCVFKTLVAQGKTTGPVVFCIPCHKELDLKKAAHVSGNKSVELLHVKDLLHITGYIRGGCSPLGMKKQFPTYLDISAREQTVISISAGQRGLQIILAPQDLSKLIPAPFVDLLLKDVTLTTSRIR